MSGERSSSYAGMSPEEATARASHGGTLLCLDVPAGVEFGLDCTVWAVGPKFKGVKMVPPGLHLSLVGAAGNEATRVCEFHWIAPGDVVVRVWDPVAECFAPGRGMDEEAAARYALGVRRHDFDASTGPYPLESHRRWLRMTSHVTAATLDRCGVPSGTRVVPGDPDALGGHPERPGRAPPHDVIASTSSTSGAGAGGVVPYFPGAARVPVFSGAGSRAPVGLSPAAVTRLNVDPAARLDHALGVFDGDWSALLGELQVAFVLFLLIGSAAGFDHWKTMVDVLCAAGGEMHAHLELYRAFLAVLTHQLECASEDFFTDEMTAENFLRPSLAALLRRARPVAAAAAEGEEAVDADGRAGAGDGSGLLVEEVTRRLRGLERFVRGRFGIDLSEPAEGPGCEGGDGGGGFIGGGEEGGDEDAPVVVELSEGTYMRMDVVEAEDGRSEGAGGGSTEQGGEGAAATTGRMEWMMER